MKKNKILIFGALVLFFYCTPMGEASSAEMATRHIVLNSENEVLEISGQSLGEQFGSAITTGDINGDGIDDLIIGSPFSSSSLMEWNGKVSIFFGNKKFFRNSIESFGKAPDLVFYGESSGDQFGMTIESGDLNNDDIDDLVIGAYNALSGTKRPGKAYVFYGKKDWENKSINLDEQKADHEFFGENDGDCFGLAVHIADINGDSRADLLVGAPNADKVFAFLSDISFSDTYDLVFKGERAGEKFGSYIGSGDINNDKKTDLFIGAYKSGDIELFEAGRVYVFITIRDFMKEHPPADFLLENSKAYSWFGFYFDSGDINGDGIDDLVVSTFPYSASDFDSDIIIFFGENDLSSSKNPDFIISGRQGGSLPGAAIKIADIDNNGKNDLLIGAPGVGHPYSSDSGNAYVFYDDFLTNGFDQISEAQLSVFGQSADDWFGYRVDVLDINADGFADAVVSSRYSDSSSGANSGKVFIIKGKDGVLGSEITEKKIELSPLKTISRGEFVNVIIEEFDLVNQHSDFIKSCMEYKEFCFFDFSARTSFKEFSLDPVLRLYPDVFPESDYFDAINIATILGLVNGNIESVNSPFCPDTPITRIQALKIVLGAGELLDYKHQFELKDLLGSLLNQFSYFKDVDSNKSHMWWYPRYVNFAYENNLVLKGESFSPDDPISGNELLDLIGRTKSYLALKNEET